MAVVADELKLVVKSDVSNAIAGLDRVEAKSKGVGGRIAGAAGKLAKIGAVAGVAAVGAVGFASAKMAMGFESAMAQIEANVGTTGADLDKLGEAAMSMGSRFGISASDAAAGLFFLQSAGLDVNDSISALESSAKLSAMGLGEMEGIANGLTTAMTNFGVSSEEAGDIFAKAVELGKADPAEMGKILNQNAAAAAATGMAYDDMATSTAYLTRITGDANKAGTQMGAILNKTIKPSKMARSAVADIGLSWEDVAGMISNDPFTGIQDLNDMFAASGVSSNDWAAAVFEDSEAIKGALSIINADMSEVGDMQDSMADRAGKMDAGFAVVADTAEFRLGAAMEGLKSALIPIGAAILEVVVPALEWLAQKMGPVIEFIKDLFTSSGDTAEGMRGAFTTIWEAAQTVVQFFVDNWPTIQATIETVAEIVTKVIQGLADFLGPLIADLFAFFEATFGDMVDWVKENMPEIKETIDKVMTAAKDIFDKILPPIKSIVETTFAYIKEIIRAVMNIIKGIITTVMGIIRGDWSQAWEGLKMIVDGIWDAIWAIVRNALTNMRDFIRVIWEVILAALNTAWDKLFDAAASIFGKIAGVIKDAFKGALNWVIDKVNWAIRKLNGLVGGMNKIPGVNISKIPEIPGLAHGGDVLRAGMVKVGESGPEMVSLPAGATVTPSHKSGGAMSGIHIEHLHSGADPREFADAIGWELTKRGV